MQNTTVPNSLFNDSPPGATSLKAPPHSIDMEQAVLGGLMTDSRKMDEVASILNSDHFYRKSHRTIFKAMESINTNNQTIDILTVSEKLDNTGDLDHADGIEYLGALLDTGTSTANIMHYARGIKDKYLVRKMITAANQIADMGYNELDAPLEDKLNKAQALMMGISIDNPEGTGIVDFATATKSMVDLVDKRSERKDGMIGISSGLKDLDAKTAGLPPKDLIIIAGRPSMGKTSLALNMAETAALNGHTAIVYSCEMDTDSLVMRTYSNFSNIPFDQLKRGKLNGNQWPLLTAAINKCHKIPLYIDETAGITPSMIRARTRRIQMQTGKPIGIIVVDYLQLMQGSGKPGNREGEISEITRNLKAIAKEFNCPVVALSQLNRGLEQRKNKRPIMSDLRESGAIEQDADIIIFVYRDEVYNENSRYQGIAELIIGKHRNGTLGTVYTDTELNYCRFIDRANQQLPLADEQPQQPGGFHWED